MDTGTENRVNLGRVTGPFGVKGWIKVFSHTEPRENIVAFPSWTLVLDGELRQVEVEEGQRSGKYVVAKLKGIDDRGGAEGLIGAEIWVDREALPPCDPDEYYWVDLEGLEVRNRRGEVLGEVDYVMATGGNDVLVLTGGGDRLIPFARPVLQEVDLDAATIVVDWETSYWEP